MRHHFRTVAWALAAAILIAAAVLLLRFQRSGTATVYRIRSRIVPRTTPLYVRTIGAPVCRVPMIGDRFAFEKDERARSASNDEFTVRVRFTYRPPPLLPPNWPDGNWCDSLDTVVAEAVRSAAARVNAAALLDEPRAVADQIAAAVDQNLRVERLLPIGVSARPNLPAGFERLRPVRAISANVKPERPVIFIGLDGADWSLLDGYMASGVMPNLKKLVDGGTRGTLQTEFPTLSPLVWTTMMTGVSPLEHQILDFTRFSPYTHEKEPITSDERRVPAIWNMENDAGKTCAQFGLWATYAAEPVHGINVSDRLFTFLYSDLAPPPATVYPSQREQWAEQAVRDAEQDVNLARMREYLPSLTQSEFDLISKSTNPYSDPAAALRRILVNTEIYRRLSLDSLRGLTRLPDLTIVYFEGTDTIGHEFAPYAPPKQPQITSADYERYRGVPEKFFRYIDTLLGDYSAIARRSHAVIVIASDHGFHWIGNRPVEVSSTATATAAKWHAPQGIFVVNGATIRHEPNSIRDICRVLRELTGLPNADYAQHFTRAAPPPPPKSDRPAQEALAKLRALGYIGSNEPTRAATPQNDTKTGGAYNNAGLILRNEHRIDEAIASFEHALVVDPHYASAMWNLSETLFNANRDLDRSDALLISAMQYGLADAPRLVIARSIAYRNTGRGHRSRQLLEHAVTIAPMNADLHMFRGRYRMDDHECPAALEDFLAAQQEQPMNALAYASAGLAQMCIGDKAAATASFARARELDPTLQLPR